MCGILVCLEFESFVNLKGCKTVRMAESVHFMFESFVNSKGCKTNTLNKVCILTFESFVNSKGCKTVKPMSNTLICLRALLI